MPNDLIKQVSDSLMAMKDYRGAWTRIRKQAGVSWSTLYRITSKERTGHRYHVLLNVQEAVEREATRHKKR